MKINLYVYGKTDKLTDLIPVEDANPTDYPISREFCQLVQALELSSEFQRDIEKARIQLNVNPDIVDLTSYIKAEPYIGLPNPEVSGRELTNEEIGQYFKNRSKVLSRLSTKYGLDDYYGWINMEHIIAGNFAIVPPGKIFYGLYADSEDDDEDGIYTSLGITITAPVSKHELIKYIEHNWTEMSADLQKLAPVATVSLSKRDRRIVQLREVEKLPFRVIADRIIQEFNLDNTDGKINEDAVKTAYQRAKKKINGLRKSNK